MGGKVDHVGFVARSTDSVIKSLSKLGFQRGKTLEIDSPFRAKITFLRSGQDFLEIMEPAEGEPAFKDLRQDLTFHHIGWRVDDMGEELAELKKSGVKWNGEPVNVGNGVKLLFLDSGSTGGIPLELIGTKNEKHLLEAFFKQG